MSKQGASSLGAITRETAGTAKEPSGGRFSFPAFFAALGNVCPTSGK
jgi:hypothetical protein